MIQVKISFGPHSSFLPTEFTLQILDSINLKGFFIFKVLMTQSHLKFRTKFYSVLTLLLDPFTHWLVVLLRSVKRQASLQSLIWHSFIKFGAYFLYLLRVVIGYRTRSNEGEITCSFCGFLQRKLHHHHLPTTRRRMAVNCPTCLCFQLCFWLFSL